jgi:hypothetical protein
MLAVDETAYVARESVRYRRTAITHVLGRRSQTAGKSRRGNSQGLTDSSKRSDRGLRPWDSRHGAGVDTRESLLGIGGEPTSAASLRDT